MESPPSVRFVTLLLALPLLAGCATVAERMAGDERDFAPYRTHEARRLTLSDVQLTQAPRRHAEIQQVEYVTISSEETSHPILLSTDEGELLPSVPGLPADSFPIDLPTALRLAGANNLQIAFAIEQVSQAAARVDSADVLWVPSLNGAVIYNNHAGRIQGTEGQVLEVSRNSLFVGAGAVTGSSPVAGGSSGPARMFADLPLVEVLFEPLAARQRAQGAQANQTAVFNDTLLATALAYLDLVRAYAELNVAEEAVTHAEELARITEDFARSGQGLQADADRAAAELASRQRDVLLAKESAAVASAELARLLRLDPATRLASTETQPVPLDIVEPNNDIYDLIGQAHALRPELARSSATLQETWYRSRQEHWRPLVPHLYAGFSSGGFGGGRGASVRRFDDRTDFDIAAVWQVENLGFGNRARRQEQDSLHRQAHVAFDMLRDQIAMEVTQAYEQVRYRSQQIDAAEPGVRSAADAVKLNLEGIRGGVLRPVEIQQAIGALAGARRQYFDAISDYNRAQFTLLRAIGQPAVE
jgi:outer membrane protein TolC